MKNFVLTTSVLSLLMSSPFALADEVCKNKGSSLVCDNGVVSSIKNTGSVRLNGTEVAGEVLVTGSFKAFAAKLHDADIKGSTEINASNVAGRLGVTGKTKLADSSFEQALRITGNVSSSGDTFNDTVSVTGNLEADDSTFNNMLDVTAKDMTLNHVNANNIVIHKAGTDKTKQNLYLREGSEVLGNITFESGNGMVFLSGESKIEGEVTGGEVYHTVKQVH